MSKPPERERERNKSQAALIEACVIVDIMSSTQCGCKWTVNNSRKAEGRWWWGGRDRVVLPEATMDDSGTFSARRFLAAALLHKQNAWVVASLTFSGLKLAASCRRWFRWTGASLFLVFREKSAFPSSLPSHSSLLPLPHPYFAFISALY